MFQKGSRKIVDFAGRGAATKRTCKQTTACLLKAKFDATREQVYPKAIITGMAPLVGLEGKSGRENTPILSDFKAKTAQNAPFLRVAKACATTCDKPNFSLINYNFNPKKFK